MPGNAAVLTASADSVSILHRCDTNVWCHYNLAQSCLYSIAFYGPAADKMAASLAAAVQAVLAAAVQTGHGRPRQGCTSVWQLVSSGMGCGAAQALCR